VTVQDFLKASTQTLALAGIESARLDALMLLEDALGKNRAQLLAHPETGLSLTTEVELNNKIAQRAQHRPLAYIRGKALFYGREFFVDEHVLVPRPETESVIELLLQADLQPQPKIADIGTGSGCIGITAALELPNSTVWLLDNDAPALQVPRQNARALSANNTSLMQNDLLEGVTEQFDVIIANLPYVPQTIALNKAATFEPPQAIFSGHDGLDHYQRFWQQIAGLPSKPQVVITESLPFQHHQLATLARHAGYYLAATDHFAQSFSRM